MKKIYKKMVSITGILSSTVSVISVAACAKNETKINDNLSENSNQIYEIKRSSLFDKENYSENNDILEEINVNDVMSHYNISSDKNFEWNVSNSIDENTNDIEQFESEYNSITAFATEIGEEEIENGEEIVSQYSDNKTATRTAEVLLIEWNFIFIRVSHMGTLQSTIWYKNKAIYNGYVQSGVTYFIKNTLNARYLMDYSYVSGRSYVIGVTGKAINSNGTLKDLNASFWYTPYFWTGGIN